MNLRLMKWPHLTAEILRVIARRHGIKLGVLRKKQDIIEHLIKHDILSEEAFNKHIPRIEVEFICDDQHEQEQSELPDMYLDFIDNDGNPQSIELSDLIDEHYKAMYYNNLTAQ
jgi:hypothetical protein